MSADLSIVIPSHQRIDLLHACLASVLRHSPPRTDILVVDDASPEEAISRMAASYAGVRCLRLPKRVGFCAAVNAGIRAARHPIVELLNDDTEVTSGWAEAALACFADLKVAAVTPLVLYWPGQDPKATRIDSAGDRYFLGGIAGKRYHGRFLAKTPVRRCKVFGASASSAFYRRDALLEVGGFPESFGVYFEDVDLSFRLRRAGYRIVFEPASRVLHHVSSSYGRPGGALLERQSRNEERVFWRNLPAHLLAWSWPAHLAVVAAKAWLRWREGHLRPFLRGRMSLWKEIPELLRHRQKLNALERKGMKRGKGIIEAPL